MTYTLSHLRMMHSTELVELGYASNDPLPLALARELADSYDPEEGMTARELAEHLADLQSERDEMEAELAEKDQRIADLERQLEDSEVKAELLQEAVEELEQALKEGASE